MSDESKTARLRALLETMRDDPGGVTREECSEAATWALDEIERLGTAIRWANGEGDSDFGDNIPDGAGRYWWRAELMRRAGL